jgi:hypothetical protein
LRHKVFVFLLVCLILLADIACVYAETTQYEGFRQYAGTINGSLNIHMALKQEEGRINGWYYYDAQGIELLLSGEVIGNSFSLREYDRDRKNTGLFRGEFSDNGIVKGYWLSPDGKVQYPFQAKVLPSLGIGHVASFGRNSKSDTFEVDFMPGQHYTVSIGSRESNVYGNPLIIYRGATVVYETKLVGDSGQIYLTNARGSGRLDLVCISRGGSGAYLNDFLIIGDTGKGIGVLADQSILKENVAGPGIVAFADKVGVEYYPPGAWTEYRLDIIWKNETEGFVRTSAVRLTPPAEIPPADKTVYFSYKRGDGKIKYIIDGDYVSQVTIRTGERLLLLRDPDIDAELAIASDGNYDRSIIEEKSIRGNFLFVVKNPGITKVSLYKPHSYTTKQELEIIVEP